MDTHQSPPPALAQFVADELRRAALWVLKVLDEVVHRLTKELPGETSAERAQLADLVVALRPQRQRMSTAFENALRHGVLRPPGREVAPAPAVRGELSGLSLVDDQAVSSDVQIAFCVSRIRDVAEFELREITAFTSALVGDHQVTTDHNPLKPDVCARALWAAAQCLPDRNGLRVAFMKQVADPFAQEVRKVYAAASGRLEDAGIQPAAYKTVVVPTGIRVSKGTDTLSDDAFRSVEGHTMPDRLAPAPGGGYRTANDVEYLALLGRIFDHILADRTLPGDVKFAISRLQPSAQRLAADDPTLLDSHDHPLWVLLDAIAWQAELLPEPPHPQRAAGMQVVQAVVAHIGTSTRHDRELYRWAADRLRQAQKDRFQQTCQRLGAEIQALEISDFQSTEPSRLGSTRASTLEVDELNTVPSQLLDLPPTQSAAMNGPGSRWLSSVMPADVARVHLGGDWVTAQLVWTHPRREGFLWADCRSEAIWPLRAKAMARLQAEGLAVPMQPRSLVKAAARALAGQLQ